MKALRNGLLAILLLSVIACSKVTADNYQKIQSGMSREQVLAILGEPSSSEHSSLLGISGEAATWQNGKITITATFVNQTLLSSRLQQQ